MFEHFEHTADLGLRVQASNLNELFAEAGRGLLAMIVADPDSVIPRRQVSVEIDGENIEFLLFDWLNELLYLVESERLLLSRFDVQINDLKLKATAEGEPVDPKRHRLEHEVKAITYHGLSVKSDDDRGWRAEVIVDI